MLAGCKRSDYHLTRLQTLAVDKCGNYTINVCVNVTVKCVCVPVAGDAENCVCFVLLFCCMLLF